MPVPLPRQSLSGAIGSAAAVLLYLDYDGTLVPIRSDPSQCRLPDSLAGVLQRLAERQAAPVFDLAVVSGRSLDDLRRQLGAVATHLSLAGNHGLEIASGGQIWRHPEAEARRPELDAVAELLGEHFSRWPLAWLEHKGLSLSLHSRALAPDQRQALAQQLLPCWTRFRPMVCLGCGAAAWCLRSARPSITPRPMPCSCSSVRRRPAATGQPPAAPSLCASTAGMTTPMKTCSATGPA